MTPEEKLRLEAERAAAAEAGKTLEELEARSPAMVRETLHELRVHQIELEMQNEELRRARVELELSRTRYFDLYELAPVGYCTLSEAGLVLQANLTAARLLGIPRSALANRLFARMVRREDQSTYHRLRVQLLATGEPQECEVRITKDDGTSFWAHLNVTLAPSDTGGPQSRLVLSDISATKQAELAAREGEVRYRSLFSRASDGIALLSLSGQLLDVNDAFARMHGWPVPELQRHGLGMLDKAGVALAPARLERLAAGEVQTFEVEHRHRDGHPLSLEGSVSQVAIEGEPHLLASYRDITERKRLQAALAQSDRLASMGLLASGIAHEMNNPMAYVLGNVELLSTELPRLFEVTKRLLAGEPAGPFEPAQLDDAMEHARDALEGTLRIRQISRDLGGFSRIDRAELQPVGLNLALENALRMAHNEVKYRASVVKELGALPPVLASPGKLEQVFLNLILNAAHAIPEGQVDRHRITLRTWVEGEAVFAEVADTGSGIEPQHLERIFEPFFTTRAQGGGSGLGLSICRTIVQEAGGELRVVSTPGQGARFIVRLPAHRLVVAPPPDPSPTPVLAPALAPAPAPAVRGRVLVIDDEPQLRKLLQRSLGLQHDVVTAASGREAKAILETDGAFDVILCDLMMPEMTGMDLHAWLTQHDAALAQKVVFISGGAFTPGAQRYLEQCRNLLIDKPFDPAELLREVAQRVVAARSAS